MSIPRRTVPSSGLASSHRCSLDQQPECSPLLGLGVNMRRQLKLRDKLRRIDIQRELGWETLPCIERGQLRWFGHLVKIPPGCPPQEVYTSNQEEMQQTQNSLKGSHISSSLGVPLDPSGDPGKSCWREGLLERPAQLAGSRARSRIIERKQMDRWPALKKDFILQIDI